MSAVRAETAPSNHPADGRADFNFLHGRWRVRHHRLRTRLAGDTQWDSFDGTCLVRPILGGLGNVDENVIELPVGTYEATTLRVFHPATRTWSIWWLDARNPVLEPPVHGRFDNGAGLFFGDDVFNDQPIKIRFVWSKISQRFAQWEQAFSADGGRSWEDNWRMEFTREA